MKSLPIFCNSTILFFLAKLVNATYVNTHPQHYTPETSKEVASDAANAGTNTIEARSLGAIPKTAFSYLNNELNQKMQNKLVVKGSPRHDKHLEEVKPGNINKSSLALNLPIKPSNGKKSTSQDKSIKEGVQDNQKSNATTPTQKTPSKLKPEAFSFLNRVIENQSNKESTIKNFKGEYKKHFVPTAFVDEANLKSLNAPPKYPENDKYESIGHEPSAPSLLEFQNNYDHFVDHTPSPTEVTNAVKLVTTIKKQDRDIKPPLPARPPPISKYPPGMFSQELPKPSKSDQKQIILPIAPLQPSSIKTIPNAAKRATAIGRDTRAEFDEVNIPTTHVKIYPKPVDILTERGIKESIEDIRRLSGDNKPRKSSLSIGNPLSNINHIDMSERPLPPVPISRKSNVTENNHTQSASEINKIEGMQIQSETANQINNVSSLEFPMGFPKQNLPSNSASEETVPILEHTNAEEKTPQKQCPPEIKPKPRQRIDIIGQQTNVSSETFHSQHKISAAITARLQKQSSQKPNYDSYEKPKNESVLSDFTEEEDCTG